MLKELKRETKGITLIALVVTIIVLMILTGVSVAMLTGQNGIINQAQNAKLANIKAGIEEDINLAYAAANLEVMSEISKGKIKASDITAGMLENSFRRSLNGNETESASTDKYIILMNDDNAKGGISEKDGTAQAGELGTIVVTIKITNELLSQYRQATNNSKASFETSFTYSGKTGKIEYGENVAIGWNKDVTVPEGFVISGLANEQTIGNGLVIYKMTEEQKSAIDWTNATQVETAQQTYDQFVWVPVENAVLDLSATQTSTLTNVSVATAIKAEMAKGKYPMAVRTAEKDTQGRNKYFGVLYKFEGAETLTISLYNEEFPIVSATTKYREPDVVSEYDTSTSTTNYLSQINSILGTTYDYTKTGITSPEYSSTDFKVALQEEYDEMVERVEKAGGFWVGRYEISGIADTNTGAKKVNITKGQNPTGKTSWYRMYAQQEVYATQANVTEVKSSMIWGSQWDQIMIWMRNVENPYYAQKSTYTKVISKYYVVNSVGMGNFNETSAGMVDDKVVYNKNNGTGVNGQGKTGQCEMSKVRNIYDLAGNQYEWTLEANGTSSRVFRGGFYNNSSSTYTSAAYRNNYGPNNADLAYSGSRLALY